MPKDWNTTTSCSLRKLRSYCQSIAISMVCALSTVSSADQEYLVIAESKKANDFFDRVYDERIDRFPEWQTYQGIKKDYDKWNDSSPERDHQELKIKKKELDWLRNSIDYELLDPQTKISYRMAIKSYEDDIRNFKYRDYNYPVNQMFGKHTRVPSFLINMHLVADESDAEAYIARLSSVDHLFDQLIENLKQRESIGVVPPKFVFPRVIESCRKIISNSPFEDSEVDSDQFADIKAKVSKLEIDDTRKDELLIAAENALLKVLQPSYEKLIAFLEVQEQRANTDHGVWKFNDGEAYYDEALRLTTTTDLTANEIHSIGLAEVERIHGAMRSIMKSVQFEGDLQAFFQFMRTDAQFYYHNDEEGKQAYLDRAVEVIDEMKNKLDSLFLTKPEADLVVKRVEAFREKSAGTAFYNRPAPDGSRPGIYYANLYDMRNMPKYKLESLAYHEGIPGHHMQLALSIALEGIPKFRKFGGNTAYIEGWGLYCEQLPKEIGFYQDPYSDFGRLSMELWRACRLVVDTGIHAKRWTREEGIEYYKENTPDSERDCIRMVERHIVMPAQATSYKIGMLKILELRENAKESMGESFDIRAFHDVILSNGAVPLTILEELVDEYTTSPN